VSSGTVTLLSHHFGAARGTDADAMLQSLITFSDTPWSTLTNPPPPLRFLASGTGEISIAASLQFVPADIPRQGMYRGLMVQHVIQRQNGMTGAAYGGPLQVVERGATVVVTVQVTSADAVRDVVLSSVVPAGLEPLDPSVSSSSAPTSGNYDVVGFRWGYCGAMSGSWRAWCWPVFGSPQVMKDRVVWEASFLSAGTHTVSFAAVVVTEGVFMMPPTHAYARMQPELFGLSIGGQFVVTASAVADTDVPALLQSLGVAPFERRQLRDCTSSCDLGEWKVVRCDQSLVCDLCVLPLTLCGGGGVVQVSLATCRWVSASRSWRACRLSTVFLHPPRFLLSHRVIVTTTRRPSSPPLFPSAVLSSSPLRS
jgi:hypothetical protein